MRLPRAERDQPAAPKALSAAQYERLIREAKARIADDPLAGARDLAIVLVLGDAGLRCEELASSSDATSCPRARAPCCAPWTCDTARAIASGASSSAPTRPARSCAGTASAPAPSARPPMTRRCSSRSGAAAATAPTRASAAAAGRRCSPTLLKRLGAAAELPDELRHPHALRHTCATELLRAEDVNVADVREFLGHASVKTTSIYLASGEQRQEGMVQRRQRGRATLDDDREGA